MRLWQLRRPANPGFCRIYRSQIEVWDLKSVLQSQISQRELPQDTGVYVGIQQMEYGGLTARHISKIGAFAATGSPFSVAAGRVAFTFGLHGPAVSIPCTFYQILYAYAFF